MYFDFACLVVQIYKDTKDEHFEIVIVDYESEDMNVEEKLKHSLVKR